MSLDFPRRNSRSTVPSFQPLTARPFRLFSLLAYGSCLVTCKGVAPAPHKGPRAPCPLIYPLASPHPVRKSVNLNKIILHSLVSERQTTPFTPYPLSLVSRLQVAGRILDREQNGGQNQRQTPASRRRRGGKILVSRRVATAD